MNKIKIILWSILNIGNIFDASGFDCTNYRGYGCKNGGVCQYYGYCICPEPFQGVDCGLMRRTVTLSEKCSIKCQNGGTCYNTNRCYCAEGFKGDMCEIPTTVAKCTTDRVIIEAYRPTGFIGDLYIQKNRELCRLKEVSSDTDGMDKYVISILHTDITDCALTKEENTPETGDVTYKATIASTFNYKQFGPRDNILEVSCVRPSKFVGSVTETTESSFPYQMLVLDSNGDPATYLAAYENITLQFEPLDIGGVQGVMVDHLEVYSINSVSDEVVSKTLINKGCILKDVTIPIKLYTEFSEARSVWVTKVTMTAFILLQGEPLLFNSRLRFCQGRCYAVFVC